MSFNSPNPIPPNIGNSVQSYTNYSQFLEVKSLTDGTIVMNDGYIHNVNDPILSKDVANKQFVLDNASTETGGLRSWKNVVNAASTGNIASLSGIQTVDGVLLAVDYRILVKNQNIPSENGIYLVSSGAWTRTLDATTDTPTVASGMAVYVIAGSIGINKVYTCNTIGPGPSYEPVNFGSDITFIPFGQSNAGGPNTSVQFNSAGVLDGSSNLTWNGTNLNTTALKTNSIQALTTSDANIYTDHEAPIILGNIVSPTVSLSEFSNSASILFGNQTANNLLLSGTNRVSGTGANIGIFTGSGSLGGSMYLGTGSTTLGAGPPIVLRPGSGTTTQGNVVVNPVTPSASVSSTTGSLVVYGGLGVTGSISTGGTLTGTQLLPSAQVFVGSSTGVATARTVTGDISINNTGVTTLASVTTAGTYATANITVDAQGRVIAASSGSGAGPGGANGVIQYNNAGAFGGLANFSTGGSNITGNTSAQLIINNSSALTGSTGPLSVAGAAYIGGALVVAGTISPNFPLTSASILVGSGLNVAAPQTMSGDASLSNAGALTLTSVTTAGTFSSATIQIDAKGRVIAATSTTGGGSGTPAGANRSIQYNNAGAFGGISSWSYNVAGGSDTLYGSNPNSAIYIGGTADANGNGGPIPLYLEGGARILKNVYVGGNVSPGQLSLEVRGSSDMQSLRITGTENSTLSTNGALRVSGGVGIGSDIVVGGTVTATDIQAINSLTVLGSAQVTNFLRVGSNNLAAPSLVVIGGTVTTYALSVLGGETNLLEGVFVGGGTVAVGPTSGSVKVFGGIGLTGDVYAGGSITSRGTITGTQILPSGQIFVGSSTNVSTRAVMSGDATISNIGALTLASVTTAGTFSNATVQVDTKGRIIAATSNSTVVPSGISGNLQFNNAGAFGGTSGWIYSTQHPTTGILSNTLFSTGQNTSLYIDGTGNIPDSLISFKTRGGGDFGGAVACAGTPTYPYALQALGLVEIQKSLFVTGTEDVIYPPAFNIESYYRGGLVVGKNMVIAGTTDSISSTSGALVVSGGLGIVKNVTIGGTTNMTALNCARTNITVASTTMIAMTANGYVTGGGIVGHVVSADGGTESSSTTTGALVVTGGAGISGNVNIGGTTNCSTLTSSDVVTAVSYVTTSDERKKENIIPLILENESAVSILQNVKSYKYNLKDRKKVNYGFLAQQLLEIDLENIVTENEDGFYGVNYTEFIPLLVESIKELKKEIKELREIVENRNQ